MQKIIRWSPFMEMEDMEKMMSNFSPAMDVYEKDNNIVVDMPVPSFDEKNVDVSIEDNVLTITGTTEKKSEVDDKNYYRKEISTGSFQKSYNFPVEVEGDKASAEYKKGILSITVPKKETKETKKKTIKINVKDK
ncbi:MAG: Hsp20/alpha crystallin family protein [Patescibacteria group bacterium]